MRRTNPTGKASASGDISRWRRVEKWISGAAILAIVICVLALIQFSTPNLVGNDGYYHVKMAELMRIEGLKPDFLWLPLTILNPGEYSDHHFLFHVLMIPFTLGDLVLGAKWASVIFAGIAFLSFWWLLRNQRIPYAGLWTLGLLAISEAFLYRMSMPRAQSLSLAVLILGLNFLLLRKYWSLLLLSFVFVWLYDGFPLLIVLVLGYILAQWLITREIELQPMVYVLLGVTFGLLINPYFPDNIIFGARHVFPKLLGEAQVRVGNEWYPYETTQLLENSPLTLIAFFSGVIALGLWNQKMDLRTGVSLLLAMVFGIMLFQSRRFIEYFPPFALIFTAMAWAPFLEKVKLTKNGVVPITTFLTRSADVKLQLPSSPWLIVFCMGLILTCGAWLSVGRTRENLQDTKPASLYSGASNWLLENTPRGTRVFQTDWDDFPRLFFHNTWNTYLVGLDPTFLQIKDPQLFNLWVELTQGEVDQPAREIFQNFAAQYVISDLKHERFIDQAQADAGFIEVYKDQEAIILMIQ